jgi:hypothetical protein
MDAAYQELRAPMVAQEGMEPRAVQAPLDLLDFPAVRQRSVNQSSLHHATHVLQAHRAHQVHLAITEHPEIPDPMVETETKADLEPKDQQARMEDQVNQAAMVNQEKRDDQPNHHRLVLAITAHREPMVNRDLQAKWVPAARRVDLEHREVEDRLVRTDRQVLMVNLDHLAVQASPAAEVNAASVRSTARRMVVCSSKMALVAKHQRAISDHASFASQYTSIGVRRCRVG